MATMVLLSVTFDSVFITSFLGREFLPRQSLGIFVYKSSLGLPICFFIQVFSHKFHSLARHLLPDVEVFLRYHPSSISFDIMSDSSSRTGDGSSSHRHSPAPNDQVSESRMYLSSSAGSSSDNLSSSGSLPGTVILPVGTSPTEAHGPIAYVSRFTEHTESSHSSSGFSRPQTPRQSLPIADSVMPNSPTPSYRSFLTGSGNSLPEYDNVSDGPPADRGYSNYVIPGMEIHTREENVLGFDPSLWATAPYVTDTTLPLCPGFIDGSCPVHQAHSSGSYFFERRAWGQELRDVLSRHRVDHVFEGSTPPPRIWEALLLRVNGDETEQSEDLLFRFRWWHCPEYRARVNARRNSRLDITRSFVYRRRVNRPVRELPLLDDHEPSSQAGETHARARNYQRYIDAQIEDIEWDALNFSDEVDDDDHADNVETPVASPNSPEGINGTVSPIPTVEVYLEHIHERDGYVTTHLYPPQPPPLNSQYYHYGFAPPPQTVIDVSSASLPPQPPCLSPLCPVSYPHAQGPLWDNEPMTLPDVLVPGPMAHLRDTRRYAAFLDALGEYGLGDLFSPDTRPPRFILAAVDRIMANDQTPNDLRMVERFRYFHCRGMRTIVGPDEEILDHEEDVPSPIGTPTPDSEVGDEDFMDTDDFAQYYD